jgi:hypothetical protein
MVLFIGTFLGPKNETSTWKNYVSSSVVDPKLFISDPDPDPTLTLISDPNPDPNSDPDPACL